MKFFTGLVLLSPLTAALFYSPSEYQKLQYEIYVLELELKHLNERYTNERLQLNEKIKNLEQKREALEKENLEHRQRYMNYVLETNEKILNLEQQNQNLKQNIEKLEQEKKESERLFSLQNQSLEREIELLKKETSEREKNLLAEKNELETKLINEINQLRKELSLERDKYRRELEELNQRNRIKILELEKKLADLENQKQVLEFENRKLLAKVQELELAKQLQKQELEKLSEQARVLEEKLKEEISLGGIRLKKMKDRLVINMDNKILFDSGSATLRSEEIRRTLDKISEILAKYQENQIVIEGHTDDVPIRNERFRDNWQLSTERALSVLYHLLRNRGLDPSRFRVLGAGPYDPLVPNTNAENRAQNRRVDIVIYPPFR